MKQSIHQLAVNSRLPTWLLPGAARLLAALWIYAPVVRGDWLWDDNSEITANLDLRGPGALWKIWLAPTSPDYFPLKTTVQWAQWQLWGNRTTIGYHLISIGLHLLGAICLWRLLAKLGVRLAWLGGLLFLVHPLAVESVAWIAELKNVLSLPPFLCALCAWVDYDEGRRPADYARSLTWFFVALLCKSSVVMLPCILLLYAVYKYGRLRGSQLKETAPFFMLSAVFGAITVWFQHHRAIASADLAASGFFGRLMDAGRAGAFYFFKALWPFQLSPIYPRWASGSPAMGQFVPWILFGAGCAILCWKRATWGRPVLLGLGFFLLNLAPVLGFIGMSYQQIAPVADHFAYVALAGMAGLAAAGVSALQSWLPVGRRFLALVGGLALAALLAFESHGYARIFENQETLWAYTLSVNPQSWTAHNNLGTVLLRQEKWTAAADHLEAAIRLNPRYAIAHLNLGNALAKLGRPAEAGARYEEALRLEPDAAEAHYNYGNLLAEAGRPAEAILHYRAALRSSPPSVDVLYNLANALAQSGQSAEAMTHYAAALRLQPDAFGPHFNFGNLLAEAGRFSEAAAHFETAVRLAPTSAAAHYALADAWVQLGRVTEAILHYEETLRLEPANSDARASLNAVRRRP